ncbi:DUF3971 domain-containing protein [Oricola nitratireducens]|uniref:YhdP family protein n=1 Tax=Oricola nitratireducens TaxID=2775868 RepID=UPI0018686E99|nr:DUF3971 domain-containing protein [Oricola nitratireducens]
MFSRPRRKKRRRFLLAALFVIVLIPLVLTGLLKSGLFAPVIENEAIASLERVLPANLGADIGEASVGVNGIGGIGVSLDHFALTDKETGEEILRVKRTRIGVRTLSALRGKPQIQKISLSGVDLHVPKLGNGEAGLPAIASIESDLSALFDGANRLFDRTTITGNGVDIEIKDMKLSGPGGPEGGVLVKEAVVLARKGRRALEAEIVVSGQTVKVAGMLRRDDANSLSVSLKAEDVPLPIGRIRTILSAVEEDHLPDAHREPVLVRIGISARRRPGDVPDELKFNIEPTDLSLKLDKTDFIPLSGRFNFVWEPKGRVLSLNESRVIFGRQSAVLSGGLRDAPTGTADTPGRNYQFELIANEGVSNPLDSPERPVKFAARAQGIWSQQKSQGEFSRIELESEAGKAEGAGTLDFGTDVPTAVFAISVENFALAGVKQFWPASVARGARRWVLSNLAGGRVSEGRFLIAEPLRRRIPGSEKPLQGDTEVSLKVEGVRFDVTGEIPPVRDANGQVDFKDGETVISLDSGTAYLPSGRTAAASDGKLVIHPEDVSGLIYADLDVKVAGKADALGELISFRPIDARRFRDYEPEELSGDVDARVKMRFVLNQRDDTPAPDWHVALDVRNAAVSTPFEGRMLSDLTGRIAIDRQHADIDVSGRIDGLPADIAMVQPFGDVPYKASRDIVLKLADKDREKIAPGLEGLVSGTTPVKVSTQNGDGAMAISADLSAAELALPWIGWAKGSGIAAKTVFDLVLADKETRISNFKLEGGSFSAAGDIIVSKAGLQRARFGKVRLNESDDISVSIDRKGKGFAISVTGQSFDARALIRHVRKEMSSGGEGGGVPVDLDVKVAKVTGFGDESLKNLVLHMRHDGTNVTELTATAMSAAGFPVTFRLEGAGAQRTVHLEALDGGEVLRFLDIYGQVRGGVLNLSLAGSGENRLTGKVDLSDFRIFNEPRLNALVSTKAANSASLKEAIKRDIDTSEVKFDRASAILDFGPSALRVTNAVFRGPLVGATFQGTVYDKNNRMRLSGTFMPAYAVNSLLADIPVIGLVLGNGRDRGLIGVTFLLEGDPKKPDITVNPLSAIAPGVFRSIFEFR